MSENDFTHHWKQRLYNVNAFPVSELILLLQNKAIRAGPAGKALKKIPPMDLLC